MKEIQPKTLMRDLRKFLDYADGHLNAENPCENTCYMNVYNLYFVVQFLHHGHEDMAQLIDSWLESRREKYRNYMTYGDYEKQFSDINRKLRIMIAPEEGEVVAGNSVHLDRKLRHYLDTREAGTKKAR